MKTVKITGPISKKEITFYVYLPAAYDKDEKRYPVSIFLHGIGQSRGGVLPRGFAQGAFGFLDRAMRAGKIGPHIQIVPYSMDKNMWGDAQHGSSMPETNVIKEFIPYVDGKYRTIADRKSRIVTGFSMGGYGAALWATSKCLFLFAPFVTVG